MPGLNKILIPSSPKTGSVHVDVGADQIRLRRGEPRLLEPAVELVRGGARGVFGRVDAGSQQAAVTRLLKIASLLGKRSADREFEDLLHVRLHGHRGGIKRQAGRRRGVGGVGQHFVKMTK